LNDLRNDLEHAVRVAAREERAAHHALMHGARPGGAEWEPSEDAAYRDRLSRWQAASQALVEALDALHAVLHPRDDELPPTRSVQGRDNGRAHDIEVESHK
jgi:uncharacterized protein YukE